MYLCAVEDFIGPRHAKTCLRAYAGSEGPVQPAHPHSLIGPLLSANGNISLNRIYRWKASARMRLRMHGMNLNLCILCMFEDTFLLCMARIMFKTFISCFTS